MAIPMERIFPNGPRSMTRRIPQWFSDIVETGPGFSPAQVGFFQAWYEPQRKR
jgi:hypothetical protein